MRHSKEITPSDIRIMKLLSEGYTQKEIALRTKSTQTAVNTSLKRAAQKVGANTTIHLVVIAKDQNII